MTTWFIDLKTDLHVMPTQPHGYKREESLHCTRVPKNSKTLHPTCASSQQQAQMFTMPLRGRPDCYWRLRPRLNVSRYDLEQELRHRGRIPKRSTKKNKLLVQANGALRGLLDYDECSLEELQRFLAARRLPFRDEHQRAVQLLWLADERRAFKCFSSPPSCDLAIKP